MNDMSNLSNAVVSQSLAGRRLEHKSVILTGAAGSIGRYISRHLLREGAKVTMTGRDPSKLDAFVEELSQEGFDAENITTIVGDCADPQVCRDIVSRAVDTFGKLDVLVNNAGNDERHRADDISVEYWDDRIAVNLRHQFFASREVARGMKELGGGSIINFGSVQAYLSSPGMSGYAVSKYGVRGVTRTLAREFGKDNIRVNTLVPGWVMTERQKRLWVDEEAEKMIDQVQCLPGRLMPEDVARMVLFLASDDSAMCTAQDFIVDAGWV